MTATSVRRESFAVDHARYLERYVDGAVTEQDRACWRRRRLAEVLEHVQSGSAFYARHLAGVEPGRVDPDDLSGLPFTTKADLRREQHDVLSRSLSEARVYYETTGTTGASTPCPRDALEMDASTEPVVRSWRDILRRHFGSRRPVVAVMGPSELYAFGDTFGRVADTVGVCHAKIWPESTRVGFDKALQLLLDLDVEVVVCAPALALSLARAALERGHSLDEFSVRAFLVLGEVCTPAMADNIRSLWGAETHNVLYGSQEAHAIATGCSAGRLHVAEPNYVVEVIEPSTDRSLGETGTGELCLTMLVPGAKPLIRYRTGDLVTVRADDCGCGLRGPVVEVHGRVADGLRLGDAVLHPIDVENLVLGGRTGVLGYQVVLDRTGDGEDRMTVAYEQAPGHGEPGADVADRVAAATGVTPTLEVQDALDPITRTGSYVSWKAARIRDDRTDRDAEALAAAAVAHRYADAR